MGEDAKKFFHLKSFSLAQGLSLRRLRNGAAGNRDNPADCFSRFNPDSREQTQQVVNHWSSAFLMLCDEVARIKVPIKTSGRAEDHPVNSSSKEPTLSQREAHRHPGSTMGDEE